MFDLNIIAWLFDYDPYLCFLIIWVAVCALLYLVYTAAEKLSWWLFGI